MQFALLVVFLFIYTLVYSQPGTVRDTKYFDIKLAGLKIGELKATRTIRDTITVYSLESNVSFWLFVSIQAHHNTETVYYGEKLFSSVSSFKTTKGNFTSSTVWRGGHYQVNVDSYKYQNSDPIYETVDCSIARLYFDEPVNTRKSLADAYGILASVKKVKPGSYEVDGLGNKNKYYYEKGVFIRASMYSKVKNYEVVSQK